MSSALNFAKQNILVLKKKILEIISIVDRFVVCFTFRLKVSAFIFVLFFRINAYFALDTATKMFLLDVVGHVEGGDKVTAAAEALPFVLRGDELDVLGQGWVLDRRPFL
jgi:hypothetical protein